MRIKSGIYKITSPSGRVYIGQSKNIKSRYSYYKSGAANNQIKLQRSFNKYGFENHAFEIVCLCPHDELTERERYYQDKYNVLEDGLNCVLVSSENKPAKRSKESIEKISKALSERVWKESSKKKLSETRKGMQFTDKHKENIRKSKTGKNNARSILLLDTNTGIFYESMNEASFVYGVTDRTISKYINGRLSNKTPLIKA